jgi:hypothetical protein
VVREYVGGGRVPRRHAHRRRPASSKLGTLLEFEAIGALKGGYAKEEQRRVR